MRLLLVDSVPLAFGRGFERFLSTFSRHAASLGHQVTIATPRRAYAHIYYSLLSGRRLKMPVAAIDPGLEGVNVVEATPTQLFHLARDADVVYCKNEPHELLLMNLTTRSTPLVVGFHTSAPPHAHKPNRARLYHSRPYGRLLARAAKVHTLDEASAHLAIHTHGLSRSRVGLIPPGVDTETFTPPVTRNSRGGQLRVLIAGTLVSGKGTDVALAAIRQLEMATHRMTFTFVGDGPMRADVLRLARECSRVSWLGFASDMPNVYRAHDLLIAPSRYEAWPLVPAEAMAAGLPVVVSDLPGTKDQIESGAVPVRAGSVDDLVHALTDLHSEWLASPQQFVRRGQTARAGAVRSLDSRVFFDRLLDLLLEVSLDGNRRPGLRS